MLSTKLIDYNWNDCVCRLFFSIYNNQLNTYAKYIKPTLGTQLRSNSLLLYLLVYFFLHCLLLMLCGFKFVVLSRFLFFNILYFLSDMLFFNLKLSTTVNFLNLLHIWPTREVLLRCYFFPGFELYVFLDGTACTMISLRACICLHH